MAHCLLFYIFLLCFNLFFSVSFQAENIYDISNGQNEEMSHRVTNDSKNNHLLASLNISKYESECDCGHYSTGCRWESDGKKKCFCQLDYAQNGDTCERCYCGYYAEECLFFVGQKLCYCKKGYGQNYGFCQKCDCGDEDTRCSFKNGEKTCHCSAGSSQNFDKCENCDCGNENIGCRFRNGEKTCHCSVGTAQKDGKCEECDCGLNSRDCHFENNKKVCTCLDKYKQNYADECEKCDCGDNSENCEFNGYFKACTCNNEYIYDESSDACERCYCGPMGISCRLVSDKYTKYTRCTCSPGYVAERDRFEMDEYCSLQGPSGWRIATYIESVFFGIIILICTVNICCKRMS